MEFTICCYFIPLAVFVFTPVWRNLRMVSNGRCNFEDNKYYISNLAAFQSTNFHILKKKTHFSTCTCIIHTLFPEGSTKSIKISTSNKDLSTATGNKKKGIVSMLVDWLNFCSDVSLTSVMLIVSKISFRKIEFSEKQEIRIKA